MKKKSVYEHAYHAVENGWTKGAYNNSDGDVCLIGGIYAGLVDKAHYAHFPLRLPLTEDRVALIRELDAILYRRSRLYRFFRWADDSTSDPVQIQKNIEAWNDAPFRRKKTILSVINELWVNALLEDNEARLTALEADVAQLKQVADKRRLTRVDRETLARLDLELDQRMRETENN